jgi:hypothetical protein
VGSVQRHDEQSRARCSRNVPARSGKQILVEDPASNPIELFEPTIAEAQL